MVKYLVERSNVNIYVLDNLALHLAAEYGRCSFVKYLVDRYADIYDVENHAVRMALLYKNIKIAKYLIRFDANLDEGMPRCYRKVSKKIHYLLGLSSPRNNKHWQHLIEYYLSR